MSKVVVILQSNYIPWKGYFDLMNAADEFVLFDEVQFTRRDWRNRNKIVVGGALKWLTIPVDSKGRYNAPINEIMVTEPVWAKKHWATVRQAYAKAPFFNQYASLLEETYLEAAQLNHLSKINELFLNRIAPLLGIESAISRSSDVERSTSDADERLIEICLARGAEVYISGPAAKAYIDPKKFERAGVRLVYADYSGYPGYQQDSNEFEHGVSIIDLLMHVGPTASEHLKSRDGFEAVIEQV